MSERRGAFAAALVAIAVAGTLLTLAYPRSFPDDEDEAFQLRIVQAPASEARWMIGKDAFQPPLDYEIDRIFERVFPGASRRRVEPALWGFLGVLAFGALVGARVSRFAGAAGAALFAAALYRVSEARRLRPYPLAVFLLLLSLLLLDSWLRRPTPLRLAGAFAAALACFWSVYLAGPVLAVAAAAIVLEDRTSPEPVRKEAAARLLRRWPLAAAAALLAAAPILPMLHRLAERAPVVPPPPALSFERWKRIIAYAGYSPNNGLGFMPRPLFQAGLVVTALAAAAGALFAARRRGARWLLGWAIGGIAVVEIVKHVHPHWDSFRYFQPALPALTALEAVGLDAVRRRGRRVAAAAALAALLLLNVPSYVRFYRYGFWNFGSGGNRPRIALPQAAPGPAPPGIARRP